MIKQWNFIIDKRIITVTADSLESAEKMAKLISKELEEK